MITRTQSAQAKELLAAVGTGAGVMYFLDRERGRRRRRIQEDRFVHGLHLANSMWDKGSKDLVNRSRGILSVFRSNLRDRSGLASDQVLVERIRAKLGRYVSHPQAIQVEANRGHVTLQGPILENEVNPLLKRLKRFPGIMSVTDQLEPHAKDEKIPALQGGGRPVGEHLNLFENNWAPATRILIGMTSAFLMYTGLISYGGQRVVRSRLLTLSGLLLGLRTFFNLHLGEIFGLKRGFLPVTIRKTVNFNSPVEEVYRFWSDFKSFPELMPTVLGVPVLWDAASIHQVPNQLLSWRSAPDATIPNCGKIKFLPERTTQRDHSRVDIEFSYCPPGGLFGHFLMRLLGIDPKTKIDRGMVALKGIIDEKLDAIDRKSSQAQTELKDVS